MPTLKVVPPLTPEGSDVIRNRGGSSRPPAPRRTSWRGAGGATVGVASATPAVGAAPGMATASAGGSPGARSVTIVVDGWPTTGVAVAAGGGCGGVVATGPVPPDAVGVALLLGSDGTVGV